MYDKVEIQKTQLGRLWSMFFVAPVLIILALMPNLSTPLRILLVVMGILTILTVRYSYIETAKLNP